MLANCHAWCHRSCVRDRKNAMRNIYIHEIGQMRLRCGNRQTHASISDIYIYIIYPYMLFFLSIEPATQRHDSLPLPSFLVMLTMRPTWRRAYTNFRYFSLLYIVSARYKLYWSILIARYCKKFGISAGYTFMHVILMDRIWIKVKASFCIAIFIISCYMYVSFYGFSLHKKIPSKSLRLSLTISFLHICGEIYNFNS